MNLVDANVSGYIYVGALAGNNSGTISNSSVTGVLDGGEGYIGGLVGYNTSDGSVSGSAAMVTVSGYSYNSTAGGLDRIQLPAASARFTRRHRAAFTARGAISAGWSDTTPASNSGAYATGSVNGFSNNVGGLVGQNEGRYRQYNAYATGKAKTSVATVAGTMSAGWWDTTTAWNINNAYATGSLMEAMSAGLVGQNQTPLAILIVPALLPVAAAITAGWWDMTKWFVALPIPIGTLRSLVRMIF